MNNKKTILVSVALAASMLATSMSAFAYTDISADHWAKSYIDNLSGKKYVSGYEDGTYKPDNYVTRAEFAKILTNIFGVIDKSGVELSDVADSAWYADTMKIAAKAGFVTGYSDGTVKPEANITRQEAAVMVYRAWGLTPEGELNFTDKNEIADWASNQVATLAAKNVLNGYSDGTFKPNNNITRAEVAKIISCAIELGVKNTTATTTPTGTTSGVLHVGGTTANTTHTSSSSSSGGSSGGGGGSLTSTSADKVPAGAAVDVQKDITKVVDKAKDIKDDTEFVLEFNTATKASKELTVTFVDPATEEEVTMTIEEFNKEEIAFTKDTLEKANIRVNIPEDYSSSSAVDITADVLVDGDKVTTSKTDKVKVDEVNYVIVALKKYQSKEAEDEELAVIVKDAKKGYENKKSLCDKWLEDNADKVVLYQDVLSQLMSDTDLATVVITKDNYADFQKNFTAMINVIDAAAKKAVSLGEDLSFETALDYFNNDVTAAIDKAVDKEYAQEVKDVAKAFGLSLASKIDDLKEAIAEETTDAAKVNAVYKVYNAD